MFYIKTVKPKKYFQSWLPFDFCSGFQILKIKMANIAIQKPDTFIKTVQKLNGPTT
jgi:hypothetical protein